MPGLSSIDGLNSGLKTTDIIDSIMKLERRPAELLEQEQAEKTNAISALSAFQAKLLAFRSDAATLARSTTWSLSTVNISDDKKLSAVVSSGTVGTGSYQVQVKALARNHQIASQGYADSTTTKLGTGAITLAVGKGTAKSITIDSTNNTLAGVKDAINAANAGVTASIVFDGSTSNAYRLILSADTAGTENKITVSSALSGTTNLNFSTPAFDLPETISKDAASDSKISLGATAAYTGTSNKTYTFSVAGNGPQTLGTDVVTLNWTDGTNSGSIIVNASDTEVALAGAGADGLKLSLSAGKVTGGDSFQVQTFAPLLQQASNAKISIGGEDGAGSPITISSASNTFTDVLGGLSITVKQLTDPGEPVTISTEPNVSGIRDRVSSFIKSYNDMIDFVEKQNDFKPGDTSTGVLFGDPTVQSIERTIRSAAGARVNALGGKFDHLGSIGIRSNADGRLTIRDASRLEDALRKDPESVRRLFVESGSGSKKGIEYLSSGSKTKSGTPLTVDVIDPATRGTYTGREITKLSATEKLVIDASNNHFRVTVNGQDSLDILLTQRTYTSVTDLVDEIQSKMDADSAVKALAPKISWVDGNDNMGRFVLTSGTYGSSSSISPRDNTTNTPFNIMGLTAGTAEKGTDVSGTINGEKATGEGQILTALDGNKTTSGVKVRVTLGKDDLLFEQPEGAVTVTRGVAASLSAVIDQMTASGEGRLDRRIKAIQIQVETIKKRVTDIDKQLALRRDSLFKRFYDMEDKLGTLHANGQFLTNQLAGLSSNFG